MQFLHYVGGRSRSGKLVAIGICLGNNPEASVETFRGTMPFDVELLAVEVGDAARFEDMKAQHATLHARGPWYKPEGDLLKHVESLEPLDPSTGKTKRVSLDLVPEVFTDLESLVKETGEKSKAQLLRRALRFYSAMHRYKAQGYMIQAVKGGSMVQFPDLEAVR